MIEEVVVVVADLSKTMGGIVRAKVVVVDVRVEEIDKAEVGIGTGWVLAPASHNFASSFSANRVTSASFAEIASIAVRLPALPEASSASDILENDKYDV